MSSVDHGAWPLVASLLWPSTMPDVRWTAIILSPWVALEVRIYGFCETIASHTDLEARLGRTARNQMLPTKPWVFHETRMFLLDSAW